MAAPIINDKAVVDDLDNRSSDIESSDSFENPTGINEKKLLRKLDLKLLPPLTLLYLLSFLDRSNSKLVPSGNICVFCSTDRIAT